MVRPHRLALLLLTALLGAGCAIHAGNAPEIVHATAGAREAVRTRDGVVVGASAPDGRAFLGIPYAAPPVGALRFRPPQPVTPWSEPLEATHTRAQCLQAVGLKSLKGGGGGLALGDEDCLYLNVYTPPAGAVRPPRGWPVIAYLPGGAFVAGAADNYDPSRLARSQDVVVLTIGYRLGPFGFLGHPALRAEDPAGGSGNYGLLDQQAALRWVRDNVSAFGGDPSAVTLMGESAGAWSACYQMLSPAAAGLFSRAILESGSCTDRRSLVTAAAADAAGPAFAAELGCTDPAGVLDCLRRLPAGSIVRARPTRWGIAGPRSWGPVWGDAVVPVEPATAFASGRYSAVPAIVGTNHDEGRLFALAVHDARSYRRQLRKDYGDRAAEVLARYPAANYGSPRLAYAAAVTDSRFACPAQELRGLLAPRAPVFGYEFADENAPFSVPELLTGPMGAFHASELAFVFDTRWVLADPGKFTPAQADLSRRMMDDWGGFVRGQAPAADWPRFTGAASPVLEFSPGGDQISTDFADRHACGFWRGAWTAKTDQ